MLAILLAVVVAGCATPPRPPATYETDGVELGLDPYGRWVQLDILREPPGAPQPDRDRSRFSGIMLDDPDRDTDRTFRLEGELLAIEPDSLFILSLSTGVVGVPTTKVEHATVFVHTTDVTAGAAWTVTGAVSTLSHGYFFLISLPVWAIVGGVSTYQLAHEGTKSYTQRGADGKTGSKRLDEMRKYARFPAGLPDRVDRTNLTPRTSIPIRPSAPGKFLSPPGQHDDQR